MMKITRVECNFLAGTDIATAISDAVWFDELLNIEEDKI